MMAGCVRKNDEEVDFQQINKKKVPAASRHAVLYACYMYDNGGCTPAVPQTHSLHSLQHM